MGYENLPCFLIPHASYLRPMYWLVKSEPDVWSWGDQVKKKVEKWDGVRNHQAAKNMRAMQLADQVFFYHSNIGKEIVGICEVVREAYPDPTDATGKFVCVDIRAIRPLPQPVSLASIKANPKLVDIALVRQSRLSVMPISHKEWQEILRMAGAL